MSIVHEFRERERTMIVVLYSKRKEREIVEYSFRS